MFEHPPARRPGARPRFPGTVLPVKTRFLPPLLALSVLLPSAPVIALPAPTDLPVTARQPAQITPVAPGIPPRAAGTRVVRTPSLRHLEILQLEVAFADLLRSPVTARDRSARQEALARIGVRTGEDLRRVASRTRDAADRLQSAPSAGSADPAMQVVQRARRVLVTVFPQAPTWLLPSEVAILLDAAATMHDRLALRSVFDDMNELVSEGVFLPHALPPKDLHPLAASGAEVSWSSLPVQLRRYESLREEHRNALESLAAGALAAFEGAGGLPSAAELAALWSLSGFRRVSALVAGLEQLGDRYRFGARGPDTFDCSGLTSYAWAFAGVGLKTYSFSQRSQTDQVRRSEDLRPGDLIFYERPSRTGDGLAGHVSMFLGWSDLILEANQGAGRVRVARFDTDPLWGFGQVRLAEERTESLRF